MNTIEMSPWVPAILLELLFVSSGIAAFLRYRGHSLQLTFREHIEGLREELEEAKAEAKRVEQEALRKRKIVTFEETDIDALLEAGEMTGDGETLDRLKNEINQTADVLTTMSSSATWLNQKLTEVMERQMEAVNMVGRLGGTGGLPPEVKEKAEAILDVFRTMDEILSAAYEETDKLEGGLAEVVAVVADFRQADLSVKLPTAESLNATLRRKSGVGSEPEEPTAPPPYDPPAQAFDTDFVESRA